MKQKTKKCKHCACVFTKNQFESRRVWADRQFCSKTCHYESKRAVVMCAICKKRFIVKKANKNVLKTCSAVCSRKNRSQRTKNALLRGDCIVPLRDSPILRKKQSLKIKKAYREGRMSHMKRVWDARASEIGTCRVMGGYIYVKTQEKNRTRSWRKQHRLVMEQHIGRPLKHTEIIHHINHNKLDNRIENLQIMTASEHMRYHAAYRSKNMV